MNWVIALTLLIASAALIYWMVRRRLHRHAGGVNDFFANAVRVYAVLNEEDAKLAALAAAKTAASIQRASMVQYLEGMASDLHAMAGSSPNVYRQVHRMRKLKAMISEKDWAVADVFQAKKELGQVNQEYLAALERPDAKIFARKHPALFEGD